MEFRCRLGTTSGEIIEGIYVAQSEAALRRELEDNAISQNLTTLRNHMTEDPNSIVVELETRGIHNETGKEFASKVMEQFEFIDGKVSAIVLFWYNIP